MTYTYALLEVSETTYKEIRDKLRTVGYNHAFGNNGEIDMHGIALVIKEQKVHDRISQPINKTPFPIKS